MIKPIPLTIAFFVCVCATASPEWPSKDVSTVKGVFLSQLSKDHVRLTRHDVESEHIYPEDFEAKNASPYLSDARARQVDLWLLEALSQRGAPTTLDLEAEHFGLSRPLLDLVKDHNAQGTNGLRFLGLHENVLYMLFKLPGAVEAFNHNTFLKCLTLYGCVGGEKYDAVAHLLAIRPVSLSLGIEYQDWIDAGNAAYLSLKNKDGSFCLRHLGLPSFCLNDLLKMPSVLEMLTHNTLLVSLCVRNYLSENIWSSLSHFPYLMHLDLAVTSFDDSDITALQHFLELKKPDGSPRITRLGVPASALDALRQNTSLTHLRIYGTLAHRACETLGLLAHVVHLDLSQVDFFILDDMETLISSLKKMQRLRLLKVPTPLHKREIEACPGSFSSDVLVNYQRLDARQKLYAKRSHAFNESSLVYLRHTSR